MSKLTRKTGGYCIGCGKPIEYLVSCIIAIIDVSVSGGRVLELFQYHSKHAIPSHKDFQWKRMRGPCQLIHCLDTFEIFRKSDTFNNCLGTGVVYTFLDGNTEEMIAILQKAHTNWSKTAIKSVNDILFQHKTGAAAGAVLPDVKHQISFPPKRDEIANFLNGYAAAHRISTPVTVFSKNVSSPYFTVHFTNGSILATPSFSLSSKYVQYYLIHGAEYLQSAYNLTRIPILNWNLSHAFGFIDRLMRVGFTVSSVLNTIIPALKDGLLTRNSGSAGMSQLRRALNCYLNTWRKAPRRI